MIPKKHISMHKHRWHKTPVYIKQFFSYDINLPSAFLLKLSLITHLSH